MYEVALAKCPGNEDYMTHLFMSYVRMGKPKEMQRVSLKLWLPTLRRGFRMVRWEISGHPETSHFRIIPLPVERTEITDVACSTAQPVGENPHLYREALN